MISAVYPPFAIASRASVIQAASVSTSLRQGITIETSTATGRVTSVPRVARCTVFMALEPNARYRAQLAMAARNAVWSFMPDLLRPSPKGGTFQTPPSVAEERGGSAAGDICPLRENK